MRRAAILIAGLILGASGITGLLGIRGGSASGGGSVVSSIEPYYGFQFTPEDASGAAVTQQQAISAALDHSAGAGENGQLAAGVTASAQYGLFTNNEMTQQLSPTAPQTLLYQNVPAWVVTFLGQGVGMPYLGPPAAASSYSRARRQAMGVPNETVIIDARTGAFIETFN